MPRVSSQIVILPVVPCSARVSTSRMMVSLTSILIGITSHVLRLARVAMNTRGGRVDNDKVEGSGVIEVLVNILCALNLRPDRHDLLPVEHLLENGVVNHYRHLNNIFNRGKVARGPVHDPQEGTLVGDISRYK